MKRSLVFLCFLLVVTLSPGVAAQTTFTDDVEKVVLDNGVTLLIKENPAFDLVSMVALSKVGSIYDPQGLSGLTSLTQTNLLSGTTTRTAQELALDIESAGIQLNSSASFEQSIVYFQSTAGNLETALGIFFDVIQNPTFPPKELDRRKQLALASLGSMKDHPLNEALWELLATFYKDYPYSVPPLGTADGIASISREHLREWHGYIYQPENLVIVVVGNVDKHRITELLETNLGDWRPETAPASLEPSVVGQFEPPHEDIQKRIQKPMQAAWQAIGYPAPSMLDPDYAPMMVINTVLGEGMASRLFTEIRDKRGLAYMAMSSYESFFGPSLIISLVATHPSTLDEVRGYIIKEFQRFADEGLSDQELAIAIEQKRGNYLINNETNINQAIQLGIFEISGKGYQWADYYPTQIGEVTSEDVKRVAEKYFTNYVETVIAP